MNGQTNILRVKAVAQALSVLNETIVFVGGATVALYAAPAAPEVRPTDDVDVVIELATYSDYARLDERLREIGFVNEIASGVICRYIIQGIVVDIMPTDPGIIGFSNRWYPEGFQNAIICRLEEGYEINIFSLPYFIASKWEAFKNRGNLDFRGSSDFEDIVYVLENTDAPKQKLTNAPENVKDYLKQEIGYWIDKPAFEEGLYCHIERGYSANKVHEIIAILTDSLGIKK